MILCIADVRSGAQTKGGNFGVKLKATVSAASADNVCTASDSPWCCIKIGFQNFDLSMSCDRPCLELQNTYSFVSYGLPEVACQIVRFT